MEKTYELSGHLLIVHFEKKLIRISAPIALQQFLSQNIEQRSQVFVHSIKSDYRILIGEELKISTDSIMLEIWGHVYASYLAKAMKKLIRLKLIANLANFIINRSDTIDCGESETDSNRRLWDLLVPFKRIILLFLPKRIKI